MCKLPLSPAGRKVTALLTLKGISQIVNEPSISAQAHALKDHGVIELEGVKIEYFVMGGS